jgi:hypothetical protein
LRFGDHGEHGPGLAEKHDEIRAKFDGHGYGEVRVLDLR